MVGKSTSNPFEARTLSVRKLLGDSESLYQIPKYQRPYKWESKHVTQLWDDLWDAYVNKKSNYFIGAIITTSSGKKTLYKDVVDGQQRLTTLIIMCCIIRDWHPGINKTKKNGIAITLQHINAAISPIGQKNGSRLRFKTHDSAQADFGKYVTDDDATKTTVSPSKKEMKTDVSKFKFQNSINVLREKFQKPSKQIGEFVDFLFDNVSCVEIKCHNVNSAIRIFQVINGRGMNLASSDLIKSDLLSYAGKNDRSQFVSDWQTIERNIQDCEMNMDDLLTIYQYYVLGKNPKKSLYEELMKVFQEAIKNKKSVSKKKKSVNGLGQTPSSGDDATRIVGKIKIFSDQFKKEIYGKNDKVLYSFWYLPWSVHWKSVLLAALDKYNSKQYGSLMETLRRFYYLHWIADKTLHTIKFSSFDVIKGISEGRSVSQIKQGLEAKLDKDIIAKAKENLRSSDMATEKWAKPLLLLIEYEMTDDSKLTHLELDRNLHLEHVFPLEWENAIGWKHFSKKVVDEYLHSAGNITLLSGSKNSAIKNESFSKKIKAYKGKNLSAKRAQGFTAFKITEKICKNYDKKRYGKKWNEKAMSARRTWFLNQVETILGIKGK